MKRAVLKTIKTFEIQDAPVPEPKPGEVLLRVTGVGVCGSDMHMYKEGNIGGIAITEAPGGLVPGHEVAGRIEAVGEGVDPARVGQRVAVESCINCGHCHWCLTGRPNLCPTHRFLGMPDCNGALRDYMAHPARLCVSVPDELSDDDVVVLEPLAISVHALDRAAIQSFEPALVLGAGPIGLTVTMLLASAGVGPIIVTDKLDYRLDLARRLGATHTFNPLRDDVTAEVLRLTDGHGSPAVFEAAGVPETFTQMVETAQPGGTVAVIGIPEKDEIAFQASLARRKGLDIRLVRRSNLTLDRAIRWAMGHRDKMAALVTHHWRLDELDKAFATVAEYADGVVKGIVAP